MRKYPEENWKALGEWISDLRIQREEEDRDWASWAKKVGRSERVVRGLERGEPQGVKTLEAVADALGIARWFLFAKLADPKTDSLTITSREIREAKDLAPSGGDEASLASSLGRFTDAELLSELGRRMTSLRRTGSDGIEELEDRAWGSTIGGSRSEVLARLAALDSEGVSNDEPGTEA